MNKGPKSIGTGIDALIKQIGPIFVFDDSEPIEFIEHPHTCCILGELTLSEEALEDTELYRGPSR